MISTVSYSTVVKQLDAQRRAEQRAAGVARLRRVRAEILRRQQGALVGPVQPHDSCEDAQRVRDAKQRAADSVQSYLEGAP